ncbi:MAG: tandem-95 repeat protein, partial [Vicinamibacterales bacterium]
TNTPPVAVAGASATAGDMPLTVAFSSAGSSDPDGSIADASWTFGDGNASSSANPSHTYTSAGYFTATLTVTDDGGAMATADVAITVNAPPVTDDVSADGLEDAPSITITLSGSDVVGTVASFVLETLPASGTLYPDSGMAAAAAMGVDYAAAGDTRTMYYVPTADWNGETSFTYAAEDNDGTPDPTPATATVTVSAVNDQPGFVASDPPAVNEDSGDQTVNGWVTSVDPGAADEAGQSVLSYTVSNVANLGLFSAGPSVDPSGELTYTPAANAAGASTFQVRVQDDGGVADGGVDTSAPHTFTITVDPVNDPPTTDNVVANGQRNAVSIAVTLSGADIDGTVASFVVATLPANGTLYEESGLTNEAAVDGVYAASGGTRSLYFVPNTGWNGLTGFDFVARDDAGENDPTSASATINVTEINDPPTTNDVSADGLEDATAIPIALAGGDTDGTVSSFALSSLPGNGLLYADSGLITAVAAGTDYPASAGTRTMYFVPSGDWNGATNFPYAAKDNDDLADASAATATITVTAVNDQPSLTAANPPAVNEDAGAQTVNGWAGGFDRGAADELGQTALGYMVSGVGTPGLFASALTVDVNGNLNYMPAANASGTSTFQVSVQDSGGTVNNGVDTSDAQTFTITVNAVNDKPSFTAGNPPVVNEDAGAQTVTSWVTSFDTGAANESGQSVLGYTVANISTPGLFSAGPTVDVAGNLDYTPAGDASGTSTFRVAVQDSGGTVNGGTETSDAQTFTITVIPVNDQPSFTAGNPPVVNEDAGAQTVTSWVTSFDPGAANEFGQLVLSYTVANISSPGLFASGPSVDAAGNLSYTPAASATGSSTFDAQVQDNGGTANGGIDVSAAQTFTITVDPAPSNVIAVESGVASGVGNDNWTTISLGRSFTSMVVVATPLYDSSAPPRIVRVRNATGASFELRIARQDNSTTTISTDVHYLVVEEGVYTEEVHGTKMEAVKYLSGVTDSSVSWIGEARTYVNPYTNPVVIGQVMTANDPDASSFWAYGGSRGNPPSATALNVGKTVSEDPNRTRNDETVGYLVFEAGIGSLAGSAFLAGVGTDIVRGPTNSPPYRYDVAGLSSVDVALVSVAGVDGGNGGWPVLLEQPDPTGIDLAFDEDQLNDSERSHTTEQVAYLVLDQTTTGDDDTTAPTPDPMTWSAVPSATGSSSISMTASAASDPSGVEYYFTSTAGGGNDSGWQDSPTYEDTGLAPDTDYTYTVTARDKSAAQNETAASGAASATTLMAGANPDVALLDGWVVDGSYATQDATFNVSAGTNRIVVVALSAEKNGSGPIAVSSVSLGDQLLTELFDFTVGSSGAYHNLHWVGYLLESQIAARIGSDLTISYANAPSNPFDGPKIHYSSYENVNQVSPIADSASNTSTSASTLQLSGAVSAGEGDMIVGFNVAGQHYAPGMSTLGYTEQTASIGATNGHASGVYHRPATAAVTQNPTFTVATGTRMAVSAMVLNRATATPP